MFGSNGTGKFVATRPDLRDSFLFGRFILFGDGDHIADIGARVTQYAPVAVAEFGVGRVHGSPIK